MQINKLLLIIIALIALILIVIFPNVCIQAASTALTMWFSLVIPSLLPFFIGATILMETGSVKVFGAVFEPVTRFLFSLPGESAYVFIASAISGYPMGAKICAELYKEKKMTESNAQRTVLYTSIGGPLFILGTVACGMLGFKPAGIYIAASHYIGAIAAGLLTGLFFNRQKVPKTGYIAGIRSAFSESMKDGSRKKTVGDILEQSVMKSVSTLLLIGGMMVLFNVLTGLIQKIGLMQLLCDALYGLGIPHDITTPVVAGILEMTNGCRIASQSTLGLGIIIPTIAFIISFGGFSIHAQSHAIAARSGLKLKLFFLAKVIHAIASFVTAYFLIKIFPFTHTAFADDFKNWNPGSAFLYIGIVFVAFCAITLIVAEICRKRYSFKQMEALSRSIGAYKK